MILIHIQMADNSFDNFNMFFYFKEVVVIIFIGRIFEILFQFWNVKRAAKPYLTTGLVIF